MRPPTEKQAATLIIDVLAGLFDASPNTIRFSEVGAEKRFDFLVRLSRYCFLVEYKSSASAGSLTVAISGLKEAAKTHKGRGQALVVVPFMGELGRSLCDEAGISWLDLSGNAKIVGPGLKIRIEGKPNKYSDRGRPPNVFAPKSSRISRQLLLQPQEFQTQAELARQTELDDGYVSKVVRRLEQEQFVESAQGAVRPRDPNLLLDSWHSVYDFSRHRIIKGHVPARTGEELIRRIAAQFSSNKLHFAATGLAAAWLLTSFASFRLVTVYLQSMPSRSLLQELEFSDEPKGANLWLVLPNDDGVFQGSENHSGIPCVSPLQTYLDLKNQPERAKDAATELRKRFLNWRQNGE